MKEQSFSSLLEDLRVASNINKTELAKLANLTPGYVSHLTRGERAAPSENVVQALADALKLDAETRIALFKAAGYSHLVASSFADTIPPLEEQVVFAPGTSTTRVNWEDIPYIDSFYGREEEQANLRQWISGSHCHVVAILGIGGIGKTSLAAQLVRNIHHKFDYVFWRSLRDAPPLENVLRECIQFLSDQKLVNLPDEKVKQLSFLFDALTQSLNQQLCLILLDNFEAVLQSGERAGKYRDGYEGYGRLISSIGEANHQSSLVLTSREKPGEIVLLEGKTALVRSMSLAGLAEPEGRELISDKGLFGSSEAWLSYIKRYSGNPLALKLAAEPIRELFNGDIDAFLKEEEVVLGDIFGLIEEQFRRLSPLEQVVMYWLAIEREPISLEDLQEYILPLVPRKDVLDALTSLRRRSMIEPGTSRFWLQPVIMEYVLDQLIDRVCREIIERKPELLQRYALLNAEAKDDVRDSQMRLILVPIVQRLQTTFGTEGSKQQLKHLLDELPKTDTQTSEYVVGNLLNLLVKINPDLSGYDFSGQIIRHAFLQGVILKGTNFAYSTFANSVFTDTFGKILSVAVSPNCKLLAAGIANNEIRLWKFRDYASLLTLHGHDGWVRAIAFSPDSKVLASASEDKTVRLWEIGTGKCLNVLRGHRSLVYSVAFSPDGKLLASCGDDQTVQVWEASSGRCLRVLEGHTNKVWSVAFNSDSQLLISGSDDKTVRLWEVSSGSCLYVLDGHESKIWTAAFSPDGELIASGSHDQTIRIWEVSSGQCINILQGHTSWVYSVAFSPDGALLASGSDDQTVRLWEVSAGKCIKLLHRHRNRVRSVVFSPDGKLLVSGSDDQTIRIWEVKSGQCLSILQGYSNEVWTVAFSPNGKLIASGSEDQQVRIWAVDSGQCIKTLYGHTNRIQAVAFSPDGALLATGSDDQTARLWQVSTEECLSVLQEHSTWVWTVAFNPDGSLLATAGEDLVVRLWEVSSLTRLQVLRGHTNWIWSAAFSPDGKFLATGSDDQTARIWEVNSGECLSVLAGHTDRVRSVAFSPDGTLLATASDDQTVRLWCVNNAECIGALEGHENWVRSVAFSPDGKLLATGSDDQSVRLWTIDTRHCIAVLHGHTNRVRSVAFSPDGTTLASGSQDGKIILWEVQTGKPLRELISQRPYEDANITGVKGLSLAQKVTLKALGAIDKETDLPR